MMIRGQVHDMRQDRMAWQGKSSGWGSATG